MIEKLSNLISDRMRQRGAARKIEATFIIDSAKEAIVEILGNNAALSAMPISVREGQVKFRCKTSAWVTEIAWHEAELIENINRKLGENAVNSIKAGLS